LVAKAIGAHSTLGQNRQAFFVSHHGWDNHDELINNQRGNLLGERQTTSYPP
jgi:uncharacterized protein (DUF1501 family)